jgi:hypothetical protein
LAQCNCNNINYFPNLQESKICRDKQSVLCSINYYNTKILENKIPSDLGECPLECNSFTYNFFYSATNFPTTSYANFLLNNSSVFRKYWKSKVLIQSTDVLRTVSRVKVFYNNLAYVQLTEIETLSLLSLLSNLGGITGLCLGMSMLSLFEFFELIFQVCVILFRRSTYYI